LEYLIQDNPCFLKWVPRKHLFKLLSYNTSINAILQDLYDMIVVISIEYKQRALL